MVKKKHSTISHAPVSYGYGVYGGGYDPKNIKQEMYAGGEEVNPEVRKAFEKKHGKGATGTTIEQKNKTLGQTIDTGKGQVQVDVGYETWKANPKNVQRALGTNINPFYKPTEQEKEEKLRAVYDASIKAPQEPFKPDFLAGAGLALGFNPAIGQFLGALGTKAIAGIFGKTASKSALTITSKMGKIAVEGGTNELIPGISSLFASTAGKTILGMSIPKVVAGTAALGISGLAGGDFITNWMAVDNALGQLNILERDMAMGMGSATPEQRQQIQQTTEEITALVQIAEYKVRTSMQINPLVMPFAKMWLAELRVAEIARNYYSDKIKNYDPLMDQWSIESQQGEDIKNLQTYGKPKYDAQGNPL